MPSDGARPFDEGRAGASTDSPLCAAFFRLNQRAAARSSHPMNIRLRKSAARG
jgi:hypothetical protein